MLGQLVEFAVGAGLEVGRLEMLKKQCVDPTVEIARAQGWVSPGRLRTRMGLSLRDARFVLLVACQRGLLYEAVNGRFYVPEKPAPSAGGAARSTIFAPLPGEPIGLKGTSVPERTERGGSGLAIVCGGIALAIAGVGLWNVTAPGRREASVTVYQPSVSTWVPPAVISSIAATAPFPSSTAVNTEATSTPARLNASPALVSPRAHSVKHTHQHHGHESHAR